MPALGVSQDTGVLVSWYSREGQEVTKGQPLMVIETDKSTVELEAPASGTLVQVRAREGDEIAVGSVIALILALGEAPPPPSGPQTETQPEPSSASITTTGLEPRAATPSSSSTSTGGRVAASPKVRQLARVRAIDLASVRGSGPEGAILAADLPAQEPSPTITDPVWRRMARNVTDSWHAVPHFYLHREVRADGLIMARNQAGRPATFTDLLIAAAARCLRQHPAMNAGKSDVNIGIATGTEQGLFVPVITRADTLSLPEITAERIRLRAKVGKRNATPQDLAGASFTISNLGMYGVDSFHAIVTDGQAGILAVGRIRDRVVGGNEGFHSTSVLALSLSCDHRIIDGMRAAQFLADLVAAVEDPLRSGSDSVDID